MPRASHITWPKLKIDYGFVYDIRSLADLLDYWMGPRSSEIQQGFNDYFHSKELQEAQGKPPTGQHVNTPEGSALATLIKIKQLGNKPVSVAGVWVDFNNAVLKSMMKVLSEEGTIYINPNGGYFTPTSDLKVVETRELPSWALPNAEIRIISWPGGRHFYAKVGNADVVVDGQQKWGTYEDAKRAAERWIKECQ